MTLINPVMIDNCDSLTPPARNPWGSVAAGEYLHTDSIDTIDKVEGAGCFRDDVSKAVNPVFARTSAGNGFLGMVGKNGLSLPLKCNSPTAILTLVLTDSTGYPNSSADHTYPLQASDEWTLNEVDLTHDLEERTVSPSTLFWILTVYWREPAYPISDKYLKIDAIQAGMLGVTPPPENWSLDISATTGGTTTPSSGTITGVQGSPTPSIQATLDLGYNFDHWLFDGITSYVENPISLIINDTLAHTLQAIFTAITPPAKHTLIINSTPIQGIPFTIEKVS